MLFSCERVERDHAGLALDVLGRVSINGDERGHERVGIPAYLALRFYSIRSFFFFLFFELGGDVMTGGLET